MPRRALRFAFVIVLAGLLAVLFVLSRLAAGDPTVELRRTLERNGYESVEIRLAEADADAIALAIDFDPKGQPTEAVEMLGRRAASIAWAQGRLVIENITVRPRAEPVQVYEAPELSAFGAPYGASRAGFDDITSRATRVTVGAVLAVLLTGALVILASLAAVGVARGRRYISIAADPPNSADSPTPPTASAA